MVKTTKNTNLKILPGVIGVILVLLVVGVLYFTSKPASTISSTIPSTILSTVASTVPSSSSTSIAQTLGGCPNINYHLNNTVTAVTGFVSYNLSGTTDYVLSQGATAKINYTTIVMPLSSQTPNILNKSQLVSWANQYQYMISGNNMTSVNSTVSKISVSFKTSEKNLTNETEYNISATFFTTVGAPKATYYIPLGPGLPLCGAEMPLITIGNGPYNGTTPSMIVA
jgi:hypothetical protein